MKKTPTRVEPVIPMLLVLGKKDNPKNTIALANNIAKPITKLNALKILIRFIIHPRFRFTLVHDAALRGKNVLANTKRRRSKNLRYFVHF